MSVSLISKVFDLDLESTKKFVLVVLADCADDYGECFPGVAKIARRTSMTERTVQRALRELAERGIVHTYWDYVGKSRDKKIRIFRICLAGIGERPKPNGNNCPAGLRRETISRFQQLCEWCAGKGDGEKGPDGKPWQIERIVPASRGGGYEADNVLLSCRACSGANRGAKLAPLRASSGAIKSQEWCHTVAGVVPQSRESGATESPYPSLEPSVEPSMNRQALSRPTPGALPLPEPTPDGLKLTAWHRWVEYRQQIKKPIKGPSIAAAQRQLAGFGEDQEAVVEQSIACSYQGLFALKTGPRLPASKGRTRAKTVEELEAEELNAAK